MFIHICDTMERKKPEPEEEKMDKIIRKMSKKLTKKELIEGLEELKNQGYKLAGGIRAKDLKNLLQLSIIIFFDSAIEQIKEGNTKEAEKDIELGLKAILSACALLGAQATTALALALFEKFNKG
jgi:hypothetical protein